MSRQIVNEASFRELTQTLFRRLSANEFLNVGLVSENSNFLRFNSAKVRQVGSVEEGSLHLELILKTSNGLKKTSRSFCLTGLEAEDQKRAFKALKDMSDIIDRLPIDPFAEILEIKEASRDIETGKLPLDENLAESLCVPLKGLDAAGLYAGGGIQRAMASSLGIFHWFETETFVLDYSIYTKDQRALKRTYSGRVWNQNDFQQQVETAASSLGALSKSLSKPSIGKHRVYFAPAAVHSLVEMLSWGCIGEQSIRTGESPLAKLRNKERRLSPLFSLSEDFGLGVNCRFNTEGELAPKRLDLIVRGEFKNSLVGRRSSKEYSCASNGANASEGLRSPSVEAGDLAEAEILKVLDEGLYLSNLHYLNWSDQPNGRLTGMTRFACFEVKNGQWVAPLETMRFDESIFNLFGPGLERVTQTQSLEIETGTYEMRALGGAKVPGLLVNDFSLVG